MKQIVVLSGKGGTGKTTVTAAFAHLSGLSSDTRAILVDADVDAANLELLLSPQMLGTNDFIGGQLATIAEDVCSGCGRCMDICRFRAIMGEDGHYTVDTFACEGCAACQTQCPNDAIAMKPCISGKWFTSQSRYGPLFHARLSPAQENSGKLIALLKQQASDYALNQDYPLLIVDGPPGTGCPVIASISSADLVVVVTEPTAAGIHDMQRVLEVTDHFGIPTLVCINKADLYPAGTEIIEDFCESHNISLIGCLPFTLSVCKAMMQGQPITAYLPNDRISQLLADMWRVILTYL